VEIARGREKGLKRALTGVYDVIIVDLMLPGKDGYEIVQEIRRHFEIPVIMFRPEAEEIDKIRGIGPRGRRLPDQAFPVTAELVARVKIPYSPL
jgi:DNA-binding response OmpR family regulator